MEISNQKDKISKNLIFRIIWIIIFSVNTVLLIFVVIFTVAFFKEVRLQEARLPENSFTKSLEVTLSSIKNNRFSIVRFLGFNSDIPHINLQISEKNERDIENSVLRSQIEDSTEYKNKKYNAKLEYNGTTYLAKVSVKGDRSVHWKNRERRSFKVKLKDNATINSLNEFSLQHGIMRNFVDEWLFHEFLGYEEILNLNYEFINFSVNGGVKSVYVQEQGITNQVVEQANYREGPIIRLDEESHLGGDYWLNSTFKVYDEKYWQNKNPELLNYAKFKFLEFKSSKRPIPEVFDQDKLAKYFAICDVLEAFHGCLPKSIRFYFNPTTELFEPIGFDGHAMRKNYPTLVSELGDFDLTSGFDLYRGWFTHIFDSSVFNEYDFKKLYYSYLWEFSDLNYLEEFFNRIRSDFEKNLSFVSSRAIFGEMSAYHPNSGVTPFYELGQDKIFSRASYIRARLRASNSVLATFEWPNVLKIKNRGEFPLLVREGNTNETLILDKQKDVLIESYKSDLVLSHNILGVQEIKESVPTIIQKASTQLNVRERYIGKFPLGWKRDGDIIFVSKDTKIDRPIFINDGSTIRVAAGTKIDFVNESYIHTNGAIQLHGTNSKPVKIYSSDGTGRGIQVIQASEKSIFRYSQITGLQWQSSTNLNYLPFSTTPLMFYESDILIEDSVIEKIDAEDMMNIFRSEYAIENTTFRQGSSDGLDTDFANGSITNSEFKDVGNDGVDVSGSEIRILNSTVIRSGDKGVSVGEASNLEIVGSRILSNNIGIASKDGSALTVASSEISDNNIGVVVFQKKTQYERAHAELWRTKLLQNEDNWILEKSAHLSIDGKSMKPNAEGVRSELYE